MATSYTTNLKLALPVTGELSGTWGTVVNENITKMVEEALAGEASVSSWAANAATITTSNGVTSAGRCMMLTLTGTLTAAGTLTVPSANKFYLVNNSTTGGYAVTVTTGAGNTVSVKNGATNAVYVDGTDVIAVGADVAALIAAATAKTTPVDADSLGIVDSAASNVLKRLTFANLWAWVSSKFATPPAIGGTTPAAGTFTTLTATGAFTSLGIDDNATAERVQVADGSTTFGATGVSYFLLNADEATVMELRGGASATTGGSIRLFGSTHATLANDINLRSGSNIKLEWDDSEANWDFLSTDVKGIGTLDATSLEVTNLKAKDGTAAGSIADSTGVVTLANLTVTGTSGTVYGNTYTPTATAVSNISTLSVSAGYFVRVMNFVIGSTRLNVTPTAGGAFSFRLSLPVASTFASSPLAQGGGVNTDLENAYVDADTTNNELLVTGTQAPTTARNWRIWYLYRIV